MLDILGRHGFTCHKPAGAYYVMADVCRFGFADDSEFAQYLVKEIGVATVPGSSFYIDPRDGTDARALLLLETRRDAARSRAAAGPAAGAPRARRVLSPFRARRHIPR